MGSNDQYVHWNRTDEKTFTLARAPAHINRKCASLHL